VRIETRGWSGAAGTTTGPPQFLQEAFRPANEAGTEKSLPHPGQRKVTVCSSVFVMAQKLFTTETQRHGGAENGELRIEN